MCQLRAQQKEYGSAWKKKGVDNDGGEIEKEGEDRESDLLIQISGKWELNLAQSLELRV